MFLLSSHIPGGSFDARVAAARPQAPRSLQIHLCFCAVRKGGTPEFELFGFGMRHLGNPLGGMEL